MPPPSFDDRRLSFGVAAGSYEQFRPTYPAEAVRWMLDGASGDVHRVADVGAGTGLLTRVLVSFGMSVTACEPDSAMLAQLGTQVPEAAQVSAYAESLPLDDHSVDAVTAAQAWHWFDKPAAAAEFARVLRPGGVVGLVWNIRDDRVAWMARLSELIDGEDSMRSSRSDAWAEIESVLPGVERRDVEHVVSMTPDQLVGLVSTFSYVRLRADRDAVLDSVRALVASHPDTAGLDVVDVPYVTAAYRARPS
jgi:SAM-dependent methyltransferase